MKRLVFLLFILAVGTVHSAYSADWRMDPSNSRLEFIATFEKTPVPGVFREFDARIRFDQDRLDASRIDVTINVTSADMNSAEVNKAIRGPDWFDFARFGQAEFHGAEVRATGVNRYLARGTLSLKGIQQPVELPFVWTASPEGATMEGELTLKRGLFRIGTGEWAATNVIGADVQVKFRVRLRRTG